jgi:hypothetical protein
MSYILLSKFVITSGYLFPDKITISSLSSHSVRDFFSATAPSDDRAACSFTVFEHLKDLLA